MKKYSRRTVVAGLSLLPSLTITTKGGAQTLSDEARRSFAGTFAAQPTQPATAEELTRILRLQESLAKLPQSLEEIQTHITSSPLFVEAQTGRLPVLGKLTTWHYLSLDATALDHTTSDPKNNPPTYGEQYGPPRTSRALAIVHIAMFEAVNAVTQHAQSYDGIQNDILNALQLKPSDIRPDTASIDMAIIQSAHDSLAALYPAKLFMFDALYRTQIITIADSPAKMLGMRIGQAAAKAILDRRIGKDHVEPGEPPAVQYDPQHPLQWSADPIVPGDPPLPALGGHWGR
jgi:hypothetical protein